MHHRAAQAEETIGDDHLDPASYLAKLDEAVIAAQRERFPLGECVISTEDMAELADEDVVEVIVANRLFRLCCPPCGPDVLANPAPAIQQLDTAWAQSPGGMPGVVTLSDHSDMHDEHNEMSQDKGKSDEHEHDHESH